MAANSKSFCDGSKAGASWASSGTEQGKLRNLISWFPQRCELGIWDPVDVYPDTQKARLRVTVGPLTDEELPATKDEVLSWWRSVAAASAVVWPSDDHEQSAFVEGFVRAAVAATRG